MLNGNDELSRPAWRRVLGLFGISTADFLDLLARQRSADSRFNLDRLHDPISAARVVFFGNYFKLIASLSYQPGACITAIDMGGSEQFSNWVSGNPLYEGLLHMNAVWVEAFRRRNGPSGIAMRRVFIVDPLALTAAEGLSNLEATLRRHLNIGIVPGVIYKTDKTPNGVVADIGNLSDEVCIEAGIIEGLNGKPPAFRDVITKRGHKKFDEIRDRVAWATEQRNLDVDVYCAAVIPELLSDLKKRIKLV